MKSTTKLLILVAVALVVIAATVVTPISQYPRVTTPGTNDLFLLAVPNPTNGLFGSGATNKGITYANLKSSINSTNLTLSVNATNVTTPNLQDTASVTWAKSGSNLTATAISAASVNATNTTTPNLQDTASVTWSKSGSNLTASAISAVSVNGTNATTPNLQDTATVTWAKSGSNLTAIAAGSSSSNPATNLVVITNSVTVLKGGHVTITNSFTILTNGTFTLQNLPLPAVLVVGTNGIVTNATLSGLSLGNDNTLKPTGLYRDQSIEAGAMFVGNLASPATTGTYTNSVDDTLSDSWTFADAATNNVRFSLTLPDIWDLGTVKLKLYITCDATNTATSTNLVWGVKAGSLAPGEALTNAIFGTEVYVTNGLHTAGNVPQVFTSPAITVGGSPAAGDSVWFNIAREGGNASDTWTNTPVRLLKCRVQWLESSTAPSSW